MTDLITDMCEKIFDCVTIHLTVFKSLLSREYKRRIDKRKKTLLVYRKFIKKLQEDLIIMKRTTKREGFTLVELLIVIVVIGILSAMMMLSSTEAVTSAKASNIVSNLRNLKTAALAMYIDSMDKFDGGKLVNGFTIANAVRYLNGGTDLPDKDDYAATSNDKGWFLSYKVKGTASEQAQIKQKLAGRAKSVGLLKTADNTAASNAYDGNGNEVFYFVR